MAIDGRKIVAFVPAKGSSDRIENKNTRLLDGLPLYLHAIRLLMSCEFIDEVYLDTDSPEIIKGAAHFGCRFIERDPQLATNSTDGNKLLRNQIEHASADIYVQLLCTSPFIKKQTIHDACLSLVGQSEYDSVTLVRREKQYQWRDNEPLYNIDRIPNSSTLPDAVVETMGLYVITREAAASTGRRIGIKPLLLEVSPLESIDVNWPDDFDLAELIAAGRREKSRKYLLTLRNHLSSAMLSDILDSLDQPNQVIRTLRPNLATKVLGRARPLRLRKLAEGERPEGIYAALDSYDWVVPFDVIVVENECADFAYFGELNANLAIRAGAVGAIIGGHSRDTIEVSAIEFPVFSHGSTCQDVRGRATLDYWNKPVTIDGVRIEPDWLIFADNEGVIVVPAAIEQEVIELAFQSIRKERDILTDIALGVDTALLTKKHGFF
jgi:CMP-N-acetylneuraminic acid synthetase/regulator of RNase E activity RraA